MAAAPAAAPSGTTGMCKDGSYASSPEKKGACRGHKGVKEWYAEDATAVPGKTAPATTAATAAATTAAATAATTPATAPAAPTTMRKTSTKPAGTAAGSAAVPGGGAGQVWANDSTKVYHCSGDRWYGKTKHGEYLSESDAKAKGFHAEHGKACS